MLPGNFKLLFSARTGSHLYGTNLPTSDVDTRGVFVPPKEYYLGFLKVMEQVEDKKTDTVYYDLKKFLKLALNNNPTMLELLFVPHGFVLHFRPEWYRLTSYREKFLSRKVKHTFLGYAHSQFQRMLGSGKGKNVSRQELMDDFGYDTKFAMHIVRLLKEGEELLTTGHLTFPRPEAMLLRDARSGKYTLDEMKEIIGDMESKFDEFERKSPLPHSPDKEFVDRLCVELVENLLLTNDTTGTIL